MTSVQGRLSLGSHLASKMNILVFCRYYRILGESTVCDSGNVGSTPDSDTYELGLKIVPSLILSFPVYK